MRKWTLLLDIEYCDETMNHCFGAMGHYYGKMNLYDETVDKC